MFFQKINVATKNKVLMHFVLLLTIAYFYYGAFYNYSFNLSDEGSVALISEKLYNGERPYLDVTLGYGLLWFYPIVFLFKLFGIKFYLIRIYFLFLAFASSLFTYALLLRLTEKRVVALVVALLVLIFPGLLFQTYIPFLVVSGAYVLFLYDVKTNKARINPWLALFINGTYLSFAFLIRGDIATIYTLLFLLYHSLSTARIAISEGQPEKLILIPVRFFAITIIIIITALPFALQAKANGYLDGFLSQYSHFAVQLVVKVHDRYFLHPKTDVLPAVGTLLTDNHPAGTLLQKPAISSFFSKDGPHALLFVTYFPLVIFIFIWWYLGIGFFVNRLNAQKLADFIGERTYLLILSVCAFSTFLQFFIWRPDMPHFSGFMPGFMILLAYFLFILGQRKTATAGGVRLLPRKFTLLCKRGAGRIEGPNFSCGLDEIPPNPPFAKGGTGRFISGIHLTLPCLAFYVLCIFTAIFLIAFVSVYEEGLITRENRDFRLQMEKGIDVRLTKEEYDGITRLVTLIKENSKPGEFVLCFPYRPGINFIADRPTFQNSLYVDDAILNTDPMWLEKMRHDISVRKPKVIVIDDWAINNTEISRFHNWARSLYVEITQTYRLQDTIMGFEVFVLR